MSQAARPRLLVALARYPAALESGSAILIHNNLLELSKHYDLRVICHDEPPKGALAPYGRMTEFLGRQESRLPRPLRRPIYALLGMPRQVWRQRSAAMRRRVAELLSQGGFAALLLYELSTIQYCPRTSARLAVACIEDPQSLRLRRMAALPIFALRERLRMRMAAWQLARYEARVLPPLGRVVLLSAADARDMEQSGGHGNLGVATYAIEPPQEPETGPAPRTEGMIVFSGNMYHPPNVDGALWFLESVLPRVLEEHPGATFWIVGARPDPRIAAAARRFAERVVVTGRVDEVAPYQRRARVSVCPVRLAIGVQTKVVEALSMGTPVVSTSAGNRGVAGVPGEDLVVEDDPAAFASRVAALLRLEDWERLSRNGRRFAAQRFGRERGAGELRALIDEVRGHN